MTDRRFPIGPLTLQEDYSAGEIAGLITAIEASPAQYREVVGALSDDALSRTYREGSWNVRQLVHHVADIAVLHYFRMKKAVAEPGTDIVLIEMDAWAGLTDSVALPLAPSLAMFEAVHHRYALAAGTLTDEQFARRYYHPLRKIWINQKQALAMSAWHVAHHLAHIRLALS